jgi:hypothetical protein
MNDELDRIRAEVNASIKTMTVRGKQYAEVPQRVIAFWKMCSAAGVRGGIETEELEKTDTVARYRAIIRVDGEIVATGTASEERMTDAEREKVKREYEASTNYEERKRLFAALNGVNETSYIENAETSAVGRALGFYGLGCQGSIASAEELLLALNQKDGEPQKSSKPAETRRKPAKAQPAPTEGAKPESQPAGRVGSPAGMSEARKAYEDALIAYCVRTEKEPAHVKATQEQKAKGGRSVDTWTDAELLDMAAKLNAAGKKG